MSKLAWKIMLILAVLAVAAAGDARAQGNGKGGQGGGGDREITRLLAQSYDLLEAGRLTQARKIFEAVLARDPGNPLALNNLAAIKVQEKKYRQALNLLQQALPRARGYKVKVNRVCQVEEICLAYRPFEAVYGDTDLEPLIKINIDMIKARLATRE